MAAPDYPAEGYPCERCDATLYSLRDRLERCEYCDFNVQHLTSTKRGSDVALPFPHPIYRSAGRPREVRRDAP